ncbi:MAG: murein hydrolase activator EnvC [Flavobacteriales bacterium]
MLRSVHKILLTIITAFLVTGIGAQTKEELERKKKKLNQRIQYTNKLIKKKRENRQLTQSELLTLKKKIDYREELIVTINHRIHELERKIEEKRALISSLEKDLKKHKAEYAKMIRHAYRNRNSYDRLLFIFASSDMYQAYRRFKYFQRYAEQRRQAAKSIERTRKILDQEIQNLKKKKRKKEELLREKTREKRRLASDKESQEKTLSELKQEEKKLRAQLKEQKEERERLAKAIKRVIEEEVEKNKGNNKGDFKLTPEAQQLADDFRKNKGELPWPVERGVISQGFGVKDHPVLGAGIKIRNNGIDIETNNGSKAKAVFKGEVSSVIVISGAGKAVMVKHGSYRTVYSNLEEVYVEKGDQVVVGQELGQVLTDESKGKTEAHFEIWKVSGDGNRKMDPRHWILERP